MKLPCEEEMRRDIEDDFKKRLSDGLPVRYAPVQNNTMSTLISSSFLNTTELA
jgi:hypothetical protein